MPALVPDSIYLSIKSATDDFAFLFPTKNWNLWNWVTCVTEIVSLIALTYLSLESNILPFYNTLCLLKLNHP